MTSRNDAVLAASAVDDAGSGAESDGEDASGAQDNGEHDKNKREVFRSSP